MSRAVLLAAALAGCVGLEARPDWRLASEPFGALEVAWAPPAALWVEVRDAEGREVIANDVFVPGPHGRAQHTGLLHDETLRALEAAGLHTGPGRSNGNGRWAT